MFLILTPFSSYPGFKRQDIIDDFNAKYVPSKRQIKDLKVTKLYQLLLDLDEQVSMASDAPKSVRYRAHRAHLDASMTCVLRADFAYLWASLILLVLRAPRQPRPPCKEFVCMDARCAAAESGPFSRAPPLHLSLFSRGGSLYD